MLVPWEALKALPWQEMAAGALIVALAPPSQDLVKRMGLKPMYALLLAAVFLFSVLHLYQISDFLYFQF